MSIVAKVSGLPEFVIEFKESGVDEKVRLAALKD